MLKNTGERLILEQSWNLMTTMEHLHRYNAVAEIVKGKDVLDAACGTGYGSHLLSKVAKSVTGIDLNSDAISYAQEHYQNDNLNYQVMSITDMKMDDNLFDVIISFETIEHVTKEQQIAFLNQVLKKLKKDGIFIVSTPNDQLLRDISFGCYKNEFHLCEMKQVEFEEFLNGYFPYVEIFYQTVTEASAIVKRGAIDSDSRLYSMENSNDDGRYYIAICSFGIIQEKLKNSCFLPRIKEYFDEHYFTRTSHLYVDTGAGFNGDECISETFISRDGCSFDVTFSLEEYQKQDIQGLRFDPCEYGAKISLEGTINEGQPIKLIPWNVTEIDEEGDIFYTLDPIYVVNSDDIKGIKSIRIKGMIEKIPDWKITEYRNLKEQKLEHEKILLEQNLKQCNEEIENTINRLNFALGVSRKKELSIKYLQEQLQCLKQEFFSVLQQKQQLENDNKELLQVVQEKQAQYDAIKTSTSWRLTKPLRTVGSINNKLFKKKENIKENTTNKLCESMVGVGADSFVESIPELLWKFDIECKTVEEPLVSVIVPNYNHALYLRERLESIYNQTYANIEVILLDDCSSDNSREILDEYAEAYKEKTIRAYNTENCGKPFKQWDKGISYAKGKLIWIAESDDYCEPNFLEEMVSLFKRESVMLAFARSVFMQDGQKVWSTEEYLNDLSALKWDKPFTMTAHNLVNTGFAVKNLIPNVSSAVFRNVGKFTEEKEPLWEQMKLCGDWVFYLNLIKGGCVSYTNKTTNYYRIHQQSTSLNVQKTDAYYEEQCEVSKYIVRNYKVNIQIFEQVLNNLKEHYKAIRQVSDGAAVKEYYRIEEIEAEQAKREPNILMCCYSMVMGGGETYPLFLANEMKREGLAVTLLDFRMDKHDERVRSLLSTNVPLVEIGSLDNFYQIVTQLGGEVLHSHHASVDSAIADWKNANASLMCKHVVSLHGMYEAISPTDCEATLERVVKSCAQFIYTADKNLESLCKYGYRDSVKLRKLPNGLPFKKISVKDRTEFGISNNDFVLCLVSRALPEKGWEEAIEAVERANSISDRSIHLIMIGEGEMYDKHKNMDGTYIHLLGSKTNIREYFSMSDVGFLPTRYPGESYPLVVIDSLMCGKPLIATDLGEIKNQLLTSNGEIAGILLHLSDWRLSVDEICDAIITLASNESMYDEMVLRAKDASAKFNIEDVCKKYLEIYKNVQKE